MFALIRKEINTFFASAVGYLVIALFLVLNGLFLWVFKGQFNIADSGFADLSPFFQIAPWILLFLIPAVTMRSIAEEKKQGTLELLLTKPFQNWQLILGKYFGTFILIIIALLPTLLYVLTITQLSKPLNSIDIGSTLGSYIGLLLLCAAYTAIGIFASSITNNQIVAFLTAVFLCFLFYFGFNGLSTYNLLGSFDYTIEQIGMQLHFERISRGILDTRDIIYFLSLTAFFILGTVLVLSKKTKPQKWKFLGFLIFGIFILNTLGSNFYNRFDLTKDRRFTLSEATENIILDAQAIITIDVLLKGDFPSEFKRLQAETRQLLEEFNAVSPNVKFAFINPLEQEETRLEVLEELQQTGLTPLEVSVEENGKTATEAVVPWAIASYQNQSVKIPLLKTVLGGTTEDRVNSSVQQLEYIFANGLNKIIHPKKKKIAILKGNGQLPDRNIADFVKTLQEYYFVGAFTLDSVAPNPSKTLEELSAFDMVINAKPTQSFSEKEKYVLDQYIMNGGKSMWLIEPVAMEIDSLFNPRGSSLAFIRDLKLKDVLFSYGARVNPKLINDLYSAPIVLASGQGSNTQFTPYPWYYGSLTKSKNNHPIVTNIEGVKFEFSNPIDTLKNDIKKTVLLTSSPATKVEGIPTEISLDIIRQKPNMESYKDGEQTLAVLLEGAFTSAYKGRIKPTKIEGSKDQSTDNKMIIIADGDVIKNDVSKGKPVELGFDRYTGTLYGNKEFLLNGVNYLLDDSGLIKVRSKEIVIPFLDPEKVVAKRGFWQVINILVPILILGLFGFLFNFIRKRKYQK